MNAAGVATEFGGLPRSHTLKILGVGLLSIGKFEPDDASFVVIEEETDGRYCRFVFRDGLMVGAILLGDIAPGPGVKVAVENRVDFHQSAWPAARRRRHSGARYENRRREALMEHDPQASN